MRRITVLAYLLMIVFVFSVQARAGTYVENFDDGDYDGWEVYNYSGGASEWKVENGMIHCTRTSILSSSLVFGEEEWRNYSIEFDARMLSKFGDEWYSIGADLRKHDTTTVWCSIGNISTKSASIQVWSGPLIMKNESRKNFDFQIDRWYHLKAIANEEKFEFHVDDGIFVSLSDSLLPTGRIGLVISGCSAQFDNVVITGDDVPGNTNAVSASNKIAGTWGQMKNQ